VTYDLSIKPNWNEILNVALTNFSASGHRLAEKQNDSFSEVIPMAHDAHKKAAEHHEHAAKARHEAAEHHAKGDHATAHEHSMKAHEHSTAAHEHSTAAHQKSVAHQA
jgi:hypothetical protein